MPQTGSALKLVQSATSTGHPLESSGADTNCKMKSTYAQPRPEADLPDRSQESH